MCFPFRLHGKNCWECKFETRENEASSKKGEKEKDGTIRMDDGTALDRKTEEDLQFSSISREVGEETTRSSSSNYEREVRMRFFERGKRSRAKQMTSLLMEAGSSQNERRGQGHHINILFPTSANYKSMLIFFFLYIFLALWSGRAALSSLSSP